MKLVAKLMNGDIYEREYPADMTATEAMGQHLKLMLAASYADDVAWLTIDNKLIEISRKLSFAMPEYENLRNV